MILETPEVQFARLFEVLSTPIGVCMALVLTIMLTVMACGRRSKWGLLALLLFFAPMMIAVARQLRFQTAIPPLHQFRMYGRPICGALLIFMLIPTFNSGRGWRQRIILFPALAYLLFELVFSVRNVAGGSPLRGTISIAIFLLTFTVLGIGLPRWLQDMRDMRAALRAIGGATLLFVGATLVQLLVNRGAIVTQGRLFGLTGNPQQVGMLLGASFPVVALLCVWKDEVKSMRIIWATLAALMAVLLGWSGSRTGGMMAVIGLGILFRRHLGRMFGFGVVCAVLVLMALQIFDFDVAASSGRFLNTSNTRSDIWARMIDDFFSSPMIGLSEHEAYGSESSYLVVAARMGLVGLLPFSVMLIACLFAVIRLHSYRKLLREHSLLVDLVLGGLASMFGGAFFEGYLLGTLSHQVFMVYIYLALLGFLLDWAEMQASLASDASLASFQDEHEYSQEQFAGHEVSTF